MHQSRLMKVFRMEQYSKEMHRLTMEANQFLNSMTPLQRLQWEQQQEQRRRDYNLRNLMQVRSSHLTKV